MSSSSTVSKAMKKVPQDIWDSVETAFAGLEPKLTIEQATELTARGKREIILPDEAVKLSRLWGAVDRVIGPGETLLSVLASAFPELGRIIRHLEKVYTYSIGQANPSVLELSRRQMDKLVERFAKERPEIEAVLDSRDGPVRRTLRGTERELHDASVAGYKKSLEEFEGFLARRKAAMLASKGAGLSSTMRAQRRRMVVTEVLKKGASETIAGIGYAFRELKAFGDVGKLGEDLYKRMARAQKGTRVARVWRLIDPDSLVFSRALGIFANIKKNKPETWKELVAAANRKGGRASDSVQGHLNQLRGLLPEEAADTLGALEAIGKRRAWEIVSGLTPKMKEAFGELSLKHIKGPFWIRTPKGSYVEFGDGASFLADASGQTGYLIALGESKSYLPKGLFEQLFKRGDGPTSGVVMQYVDEAGELRSITMNPPLGGGAPAYVFSRPKATNPLDAERLEQMVKERVSSEREVMMLDLPFTRAHNEAFVAMLFKECVAMLEELSKSKR